MRKQYKILRKSLHGAEKDKKITQNALNALQKYDSFFVYLSFGTEAETGALISALLSLNKKVCVPRVEGDTMYAVPLGELYRHELGFYQPSEGEDTPCEVAIVPLLAVDKEGVRLGYGGGFYDRYFACHGDILKVGFCYAGQAVEQLPKEQTDIPLDMKIDENGVTAFSQKGFIA